LLLISFILIYKKYAGGREKATHIAKNAKIKQKLATRIYFSFLAKIIGLFDTKMPGPLFFKFIVHVTGKHVISIPVADNREGKKGKKDEVNSAHN